MTAWHSPWPQSPAAWTATGIAAPVVFDKDGKLDVGAGGSRTTSRPSQIIDLGNVPNVMPSILREMDAAVFTNRSEGGTNLVAMECMACGIPVVLSRNTGHLDLIKDDNCFPLTTSGGREPMEQRRRRACWGESQVEEVVERFEQIFADRAAARQRGMRAAAMMSEMTWAETARQMKAVVMASSKAAVPIAA